ncbi:MAG: efflux RND transporter periplasmic adaptor subunit, partial [Deltaproteobacteria bacterium CG17_big_fil_post_rev_8_21_14_2_50_51_6]
DGLLKPGMFIRAQIEFSVFENATVVPVDALTKRGGRPGVFIADRENLK